MSPEDVRLLEILRLVADRIACEPLQYHHAVADVFQSLQLSIDSVLWKQVLALVPSNKMYAGEIGEQLTLDERLDFCLAAIKNLEARA